MVSVSKSRFAVLKIEDEDDDGKNQSSGASSNQSSSAAAKKKNKKKKQKEADESLRNLAFGRQTGPRTHKSSGGSGDHKQGRQRHPAPEPENWDEWKKRDEETTQDMFEKDLQQALLQSRMEAEQQKQSQKVSDSQAKAGAPVDNKDGGKKKKKPQAMSLDQFNQLPPETKPGSDDEEPMPSPPPVHTRVPVGEQDPKYFDSVQSDVTKIVQKERIQEEYKKQYAQESAMASKYRDQLEKKDEVIAQLKGRIQEQDDELKQVKKRNKQLCVILAQGEMKDKAQVLMQVEELTAVKDELTEQMSTLTAELEKERSKVHALKAENDKLKGKHGPK